MPQRPLHPVGAGPIHHPPREPAVLPDHPRPRRPGLPGRRVRAVRLLPLARRRDRRAAPDRRRTPGAGRAAAGAGDRRRRPAPRSPRSTRTRSCSSRCSARTGSPRRDAAGALALGHRDARRHGVRRPTPRPRGERCGARPLHRRPRGRGHRGAAPLHRPRLRRPHRRDPLRRGARRARRPHAPRPARGPAGRLRQRPGRGARRPRADARTAVCAPALCDWVRERVDLAREEFRVGRRYLARLESRRCRLAGHAYLARFEWVLDTVERDGYLLRECYPQRRTVRGGLAIACRATGSVLAAPPAARELAGSVEVSRPHVVVIGAGVGGLSAAIHLARRGMRVTVVEKNARPGGRLGSYERDGHVFPTGPTLLIMPLLYRSELAALGADLDADLEPQRVDPSYRIVFDDGERLDMTSDLAALSAQLEAMEPGPRAALLRYLDEGRRHYHLGMPRLVERDFRRARDFFRPANAALMLQVHALAAALPAHGCVLRLPAAARGVHVPGRLHGPEPVPRAGDVLADALQRARARGLVPARRDDAVGRGARRPRRGGRRRDPLQRAGAAHRGRGLGGDGAWSWPTGGCSRPTSCSPTRTCPTSTGTCCPAPRPTGSPRRPCADGGSRARRSASSGRWTGPSRSWARTPSSWPTPTARTSTGSTATSRCPTCRASTCTPRPGSTRPRRRQGRDTIVAVVPTGHMVYDGPDPARRAREAEAWDVARGRAREAVLARLALLGVDRRGRAPAPRGDGDAADLAGAAQPGARVPRTAWRTP